MSESFVDSELQQVPAYRFTFGPITTFIDMNLSLLDFKSAGALDTYLMERDLMLGLRTDMSQSPRAGTRFAVASNLTMTSGMYVVVGKPASGKTKFINELVFKASRQGIHTAKFSIGEPDSIETRSTIDSISDLGIQLFELKRSNAPAVLFIDSLMMSQRASPGGQAAASGGHSPAFWAWLSAISHVAKAMGIVIIAVANLPDASQSSISVSDYSKTLEAVCSGVIVLDSVDEYNMSFNITSREVTSRNTLAVSEAIGATAVYTNQPGASEADSIALPLYRLKA